MLKGFDGLKKKFDKLIGVWDAKANQLFRANPISGFYPDCGEGNKKGLNGLMVRKKEFEGFEKKV